MRALLNRIATAVVLLCLAYYAYDDLRDRAQRDLAAAQGRP
jgi:hypothetical protein